MKWNEARKVYPNKWILFEAMEAYSENSRRIVEELSIIMHMIKEKKLLKSMQRNIKRIKVERCMFTMLKI